MSNPRGFANLPSDAVFDTFTSPIGELTLIGSSHGLHAVWWESDLTHQEFKTAIAKLRRTTECSVLQQAKMQIELYFSGKLNSFDLPLVIEGTGFQRKAWRALQSIPFGETISYGEQAARIGDKNKARAVGGANRLNPICIVIPCHRVIGANGLLVGFGGGVAIKSFLLSHEKRTRAAHLKNANDRAAIHSLSD